MNLKTIKNFIVKHAPTILSVAACVGVVVTAGVAANDGVKAHEKLEEKRKQSDEDLTTVEKVKTAATCYIPTVVSAGLTIGCIVASHKISSDRLLAMTGAYTTLSNQFKEYRTKVSEQYGEEQEQEIRKSIVEDHMNSGVPVSSEREIIFYEPTIQKYFTSTMSTVKQAEGDLNRLMIQSGTATFNDWLGLLGLDQYKKPKYDELGWSQNHDEWVDMVCYNQGYVWIDFSHFVSTHHKPEMFGREVCELSYTYPLEFEDDVLEDLGIKPRPVAEHLVSKVIKEVTK